MRLELLLKELKDSVTRENFERVQTLFADLRLLDGDWQFFDVDLPTAGLNEIKHKLSFAPKDIILLSALGNQSFYFRYQNFDRDKLYIYTNGPVRIRFFAGVISEGVYGQSSANSRAEASAYPSGAPGITKRTTIDFGASPVGQKTFNIVDADVSITSPISASLLHLATSQDADEAELTPINFICQPKNGSFDMIALPLEGRAYGEFVVAYRVG